MLPKWIPILLPSNGGLLAYTLIVEVQDKAQALGNKLCSKKEGNKPGMNDARGFQTCIWVKGVKRAKLAGDMHRARRHGVHHNQTEPWV